MQNETTTDTKQLTDSELTNNQIRALGIESGQAGDHAMALICSLACGDVVIDEDTTIDSLRIATFIDKADLVKIATMDREACRARCLDVINWARGME